MHRRYSRKAEREKVGNKPRELRADYAQAQTLTSRSGCYLTAEDGLDNVG